MSIVILAQALSCVKPFVSSFFIKLNKKLLNKIQSTEGVKKGFAETMAEINEMRKSDETKNYKQARLDEINGNKKGFTRDSIRTDFA